MKINFNKPIIFDKNGKFFGRKILNFAESYWSPFQKKSPIKVTYNRKDNSIYTKDVPDTKKSKTAAKALSLFIGIFTLGAVPIATGLTKIISRKWVEKKKDSTTIDDKKKLDAMTHKELIERVKSQTYGGIYTTPPKVLFEDISLRVQPVGVKTVPHNVSLDYNTSSLNPVHENIKNIIDIPKNIPKVMDILTKSVNGELTADQMDKELMSFLTDDKIKALLIELSDTTSDLRLARKPRWTMTEIKKILPKLQENKDKIFTQSIKSVSKEDIKRISSDLSKNINSDNEWELDELALTLSKYVTAAELSEILDNITK